MSEPHARGPRHERVVPSDIPATGASARSPTARTSRTPKASTSRSSACRSTPARASAPGRASAPRRSARRRSRCGRSTRPRGRRVRAAARWSMRRPPGHAGNAERTMAQIADGLRPLVAAGGDPIVLGGDHTVALGELRAHAERARPARGSCCSTPTRTPGTPTRASATSTARRSGARSRRGCWRRSARCWPACAARCTRPATSTTPRELGFEMIRGDELRALSPAEYARRVRERVGDGPAYLSFDIDVLDPAFAPGTGTPEIAGLLPHEALGLPARAGRDALRGLRRRRGLAAVRRRRAGHGAAGRQRRVRVPRAGRARARRARLTPRSPRASARGAAHVPEHPLVAARRAEMAAHRGGLGTPTARGRVASVSSSTARTTAANSSPP